jgi:DNA-binding MarR family transcriptional regulator
MVNFTARGKKRIEGMMREPARVLVHLTENLDEEERSQVYEMVESINRVLWLFIGARET